MLYNLLYGLKDHWFGFNVFRYITLRAGLACITAFMICLIFGPFIIEMLRRLKVGQSIRKDHVADLYELHKHKTGTPTMGGFMILLAVMVSTVLWARLDNRFVILSMMAMLWLGLIGFFDDYIKIIKGRNLGLSAGMKFIGQIVVALFVAVYLYRDLDMEPTLMLPFFKNVVINLGIFYVPFVMLVIISASNAVNLTDGLDGLAIGCVLMVSIAYALISYVTGNVNMSSYLNIFYLPGAGELTVLCGALIGACFGFLWYNCHPASVFMGDTGSLALGGVIGVLSVLLKKEIVLIIVGGIFVLEAGSVILQVLSFKTRGKRIFKMSPLHHHFQLSGVHESKIIIRFWIIAILLMLISIVTLKLQ